jgi:hypothetical protein
VPPLPDYDPDYHLFKCARDWLDLGAHLQQIGARTLLPPEGNSEVECVALHLLRAAMDGNLVGVGKTLKPLAGDPELWVRVYEARERLSRQLCSQVALFSAGVNGKPEMTDQEDNVVAKQPRGRPRWDEEHKRLYLDEEIVKQYTRPAKNQQLLLQAFEEDEWSEQIYDPLNTGKLRDTLDSLNKTLKGTPLRFHATNDGKAISWEIKDLTSS